MTSKTKNYTIKSDMTSSISSQSIQKIITALTQLVDKLSTSVYESKDSSPKAFMNSWGESTDIISKIIKSAVGSKTVSTKDKNAPKRGKSSYILWCSDNRAAIVSKNPDMSAKEIISELGRIWRENIDESVKNKYKELAVEDKARFSDEMKMYTPIIDVDSKKVKKVREGPKRGLSSYMFFCQSERISIKNDMPDVSAKDTTIELGVRWRALSDDDKKTYQKLAEKDKKRYNKEKSKYELTKTSDVDDSVDDLLEEKTPTKTSEKVKSKSKAKAETFATKKNGYIIYCHERRGVVSEEQPDLSKSELTKWITAEWKSLDEKEKTEYNDRARNGEQVTA
jgi:hypothetical protein